VTLIPLAEAQDQGPKTAAEASKEAAPNDTTITSSGRQPFSATPVKAVTEDELVKMAAASFIDSLSDLPQNSSTLNAALGGQTIPSVSPILLAQAQEQGPPAAAAAPKEPAEQVSEVTITGTRIQLSPGMVTPTPVTAVTQEELVKMAPTQAIDALSHLQCCARRPEPERRGGQPARCEHQLGHLPNPGAARWSPQRCQQPFRRGGHRLVSR
jgi:hypothetical protein